MTYLSINLTKYAQDLSEKNYKTLMKDIKELNGERVHVHGQEDSVLSRYPFST